MSVLDLFWIFVIVALIQPVLSRKFLEAARQRFITRLERERDSRVVLLVYRQETYHLLGFPVHRCIDIEDAESVMRAISLTDPESPLDIVLHLPEGLVIPATQIARAIHKHPGKVTVFVPHSAMSGGTIIALAADAIVMCNHAVLGPVDPHIGPYPAASLLKVLETKSFEHIDDATVVRADQARKALEQTRQFIFNLLADDLDPEKATGISRKLAEGLWTDEHPIGCDEAAALGLPVSTDMPEDIMRLLTLYPQPVRCVPSMDTPPPRGSQPAPR